MKQNYKFIKYQSIYDPETEFYALERDVLEKMIDGARFIEVTPDFKRVQFVRADSLKAVGSIMKQY